METVTAQWTISLDTDCPACGEYVDLTDHDDFWLEREDFQPGDEVAELVVVCPKCGVEFAVNTEN